MRKIVSVSLFGEGDEYARYLPAHLRGHLNLFPLDEDWRLRVHVDDRVAGSETGKLLLRCASDDLVDLRLIVHRGGKLPRCRGMIQRIAPVFEEGVDYVFCRDLDSPPMPRDRACCEQFIASGATVHTIHDSDQHVLVMGGLCGFWTPRLRNETGLGSLDDLIAAVGFTDSQWDVHGADQIALNRVLLRAGGPLLLEHRYSGWHNGPGARPTRGKGMYPCEAWSTPVPNACFGNERSKLSIDWFPAADHLGAHLGCAGYDYKAAVEFWDAHGDSRIAARVAACEVAP